MFKPSAQRRHGKEETVSLLDDNKKESRRQSAEVGSMINSEVATCECLLLNKFVVVGVPASTKLGQINMIGQIK